MDGYRGLYQVSSYGRVRGVDRSTTDHNGHRKRFQKGIVLKPALASNGYYTVNLCLNGKPTSFCIHKLVALTFIENPNGYTYIDHINTIRTDNRACNLRWCTQKMNSNNPVSRVRLSESLRKSGWKISAKLLNRPDLSKPVAQIDPRTNAVIRVWPSSAEAGRVLGLNKANLKCCANGTQRKIGNRIYYRTTVGGYKWKFV